MIVQSTLSSWQKAFLNSRWSKNKIDISWLLPWNEIPLISRCRRFLYKQIEELFWSLKERKAIWALIWCVNNKKYAKQLIENNFFVKRNKIWLETYNSKLFWTAGHFQSGSDKQKTCLVFPAKQLEKNISLESVTIETEGSCFINIAKTLVSFLTVVNFLQSKWHDLFTPRVGQEEIIYLFDQAFLLHRLYFQCHTMVAW